MTETTSNNGRLGNQIIRNLAVNILAKKFNLYVNYSSYELINKLGLDLFIGENKYNNFIKLTDENYFDILNNEKLESNLDPNNNFFQTKEITNFLYSYINENEIKNKIIKNNKFNDRYNNNNDCYIHIRLDDAEKFNPGYKYYKKTLNSIKFDNLYISSDNINHDIIKNLKKDYNCIILYLNIIDTIKFASTNKYIILSHGSFSAVIGYLSFFSEVRYPKYDINKIWYGDMFSIPNWIEYDYENVKFDIVIPVGPNDYSIIEKQLEYTKKNIINYRNIYIITSDSDFSIEIEGVIKISENIFPFSIDTVSKYHGKINRNGWYLQQLLKLYSGLVIPNILDKYLVIDSDTFFIKPTYFFDNEIALYGYSNEYHNPYFIHMKKLDDIFFKQFSDKSGICHHIIFETKYINEIIDIVENKHNDKFYNVFLKTVMDIDIPNSGASEYELYFNYIFYKHPDKVKLRQLNWKNTSTLDLNNNYDYISYHWYSR